LEWKWREARVGILVNNAGVELIKPLGKIPKEDFTSVYDLNVCVPMLLTQAILPFHPSGGRMITIPSIDSRAGFA